MNEWQSWHQDPSFFNIYLFIDCSESWLWHAGSSIVITACGIFSCGIWDLVLWPGIKPGPPALGARSLSKWTTGQVTESKVLNSWSGTFWLNSSVSKGKLSCAQKPLPPKARTTQCVHFFDTSFLQGGFCMDAFWLFESHQCAHKIVHICA